MVQFFIGMGVGAVILVVCVFAAWIIDYIKNGQSGPGS